MKEVKEKAEIYSEKEMTIHKQIRIKNFVDSRLAMWEANIGESLELQVKKIEELLNNGYEFEISDSLRNDKQFQKVVSKLLTKNEK